MKYTVNSEDGKNYIYDTVLEQRLGWFKSREAAQHFVELMHKYTIMEPKNTTDPESDVTL